MLGATCRAAYRLTIDEALWEVGCARPTSHRGGTQCGDTHRPP